MFRVIRKQTALLVLTLLATTMATAQTVNMNKYITLTVQQGEQIRLNLMAAAAGTGVKIVSGSTNQTITVGTNWTGYRNYTAGSTTMTVYGDITGFGCDGNEAKLTALNVSQNTALTRLFCQNNQITALNVTQNRALTELYCQNNQITALNVTHNTALTELDCAENQLTALDVSQNTALKELVCYDNQLTALDVSQNTALTGLLCYGNSFTTQAFNDLMCSLPARVAADDAKFYPLYNASDAGASAFMATNAQIAKNKGWQVRYWEGNEDEIPATTGTYVCGGGSGSVNMSKYVTLTVQQGQRIQLQFQAAAAGTKVKVVSGSTDTEVTVGTSWTGSQSYTAGSTTMTVYGDITGFVCSDNGAKLTALDVTQNTALTVLNCRDNQLTSLNVSQNTALTKLRCDGNSFTTQAFNLLMCSLPARATADDAKFYPLRNASDAGASAFMAANAQIATGKNWQVRYGDGGAIPATTGTYVCPVVNMNKYITLTVQQGEQIQLDLMAAAANTPVKIVSGSNETAVTVGTSWTSFQNYTAGAGTMTVYGDITGFDCSDNGANLTALDVTQNTALIELFCYNNRLTSLDVSHNTALTGLWCYDNQLTALDVTQNRALKYLSCDDNNFTTQAFNDLMCSLPARTAADNAKFFPLYDASDAKYADFMAANSQIAKNKNWKVHYAVDGADVPATTGTYVCPAADIAEIASVPLAVYPNPATDILTVETEATGAAITIADLTGRTVMTATATAGKTTLNIAHLSAGTYIVRVGNRVGKVVKR